VEEKTEPTRGSESLSDEDLRDRLERAEKVVDDLQAALDSRVVIEQAKGILRERFGWTVDEAFEMLRYAARTARMSIHELAAHVVARNDTPNPVVVAIARSTRWRAAAMRELAELHRERAHELERAVREQQERLAWSQRDKAQRSRRRPQPSEPESAG